MLDLTTSYEQGQWGLFAESAARLKISEELMPDLFRKAVKWAGHALDEM